MELANQPTPSPEDTKKEELGLPLTIISFCIPIVGAVLYFTYKGDNPGKASTACYAALAGLLVGIVMRIITMAAGGQ